MNDAMNRLDAARRVVVTGMGAVSPAGVGVEVLWGAMMEARLCLGPLTRFDPELVDMRIAGEIPDFDPVACGLAKKDARRYDPFLQYAVIAAREAIAQSGIDIADEDASRCATIVGSGIGGLATLEREHSAFLEKGSKRISPFFIPMMIPNIAGGTIAIETGFKGSCLDVTSACATGTHAIGEAFRLIRHGYADVALCGGTEGCITPMCIGGFSNLQALSHGETPETASLPFDINRSGFVPGEGAGILVIESLEHALERRATILAEIGGYGSTCDAYHITAPDPEGEGSIRAMRECIAQAGISPDEVDHVNAHGTGTKLNDSGESHAIEQVFGARSAEMYTTSVKGALGHMLGAAGAVEAIVSILTIANDAIPATVGFSTPDPECAVRVPTFTVEGSGVRTVLSNSLGFGGHNAALLFERYGG